MADHSFIARVISAQVSLEAVQRWVTSAIQFSSPHLRRDAPPILEGLARVPGSGLPIPLLNYASCRPSEIVGALEGAKWKTHSALAWCAYIRAHPDEDVEPFDQEALEALEALPPAPAPYTASRLDEVMDEWISCECSIHSSHTTRTSQLYASFSKWCEKNSKPVWPRREWEEMMERAGFLPEVRGIGPVLTGIHLRKGEDAYLSHSEQGSIYYKFRASRNRDEDHDFPTRQPPPLNFEPYEEPKCFKGIRWLRRLLDWLCGPDPQKRPPFYPRKSERYDVNRSG